MKLPTFALVFVFVAVAFFWLWYLFFNIFEVRFYCLPKQGEIAPGSRIKFVAEPVNALGKRVLWRKVDFKAEIVEGEGLAEESSECAGDNGVCFVAGRKQGKVKIRVTSDYAHSPSVFEFEIK